MTGVCSWQIMQLDCDPTASGKQNVVIKIYWRRFAIDGQRVADTYGTQKIAWEPGAPFTPYHQLTEAQVKSWLETAMGPDEIAALDANLNKQIEDQINPPVTQPPLPWA